MQQIEEIIFKRKIKMLANDSGHRVVAVVTSALPVRHSKNEILKKNILIEKNARKLFYALSSCRDSSASPVPQIEEKIFERKIKKLANCSGHLEVAVDTSAWPMWQIE